MAKKRRSSTIGSLMLNTFALAFTLLPIITIGLWTHQTFFNDNRQVIELAQVRSDESPRLFAEPIISVTFDDGWESIYSQAAPIMSQHNIASTQYILPGEFNRPIYLSVAQALSLKEAGHDISSHTYSHQKLTEASNGTVDSELDRSIEILEKFGLLYDSNRTFAAPNGALGGYSEGRVKQLFALARNVDGDLSRDVSSNDMNVAGKTHRYDIIGYTVGQYTTLEQLEAALDYAQQHNAWFVPVYHQIDDSGEVYSVTPDDFDSHMALFRSSGIKIVTMRDVLVNNQDKL